MRAQCTRRSLNNPIALKILSILFCAFKKGMVINMKDLTVTIVGLGLIGGSIARSLKSRVNKLYAIDRDSSVLEFAQEQGIADNTPANAISMSDMVILCIYPNAAIDFIKDNLNNFKKEASLCKQ